MFNGSVTGLTLASFALMVRRFASHRIASHRIASHRIASHRIASYRHHPACPDPTH
jgi:thymidylate synthase ThyX